MTKRFIVSALFSTLLVGVTLMTSCAPSDTSAAATGGATRVFEMRTYTAYPGKLADLQTRFRDHTLRLFERHGMTNVGYWVPQDSTGENTLVYILAYPSREDAERMWAAFRADPEWVEAKAASEEDGLLVERVVSVFMDPTDFSPLK